MVTVPGCCREPLLDAVSKNPLTPVAAPNNQPVSKDEPITQDQPQADPNSRPCLEAAAQNAGLPAQLLSHRLVLAGIGIP